MGLHLYGHKRLIGEELLLPRLFRHTYLLIGIRLCLADQWISLKVAYKLSPSTIPVLGVLKYAGVSSG